MNNKINMSIIDANIKLQDENKMVKNDNLILQRRMTNAANYLKSKLNKFKLLEVGEEAQTAIDILEGNYVYEEKKKKVQIEEKV